jgi:hypothetical protein
LIPCLHPEIVRESVEFLEKQMKDALYGISDDVRCIGTAFASLVTQVANRLVSASRLGLLSIFSKSLTIFLFFGLIRAAFISALAVAVVSVVMRHKCAYLAANRRPWVIEQSYSIVRKKQGRMSAPWTQQLRLHS